MNYINEFHFIRPWFLLLVIPAIFLPFFVPFILKNSNAWHRITDIYLVKHLFEKKDLNLRSLKILVLMISLSFAISLSGPSFFKIKVKAMKNRIPTVFVMDLSLSMQASDVKPNRIKIASRVVKRILDEIKGNTVGLVVFTDEPYRIVPITDDTEVISNLLPLLGVRIMPTFGSRPDRALTLAYDMIANQGEKAGHIILVTDGVGEVEKETVSILKDEYYNDVYVSVLGIGTAKGAPVPRLDAGFVKNPDGSLVMTSLDEVTLEKIARFGKGYYLNQNISSSSIKKLIDIINDKIWENQSKDSEKSEDVGYWFILPIVIMLPFFFKKTMLNLILFGLILMPKTSRAEFKELWFNSNQVGIYYFKKEEYGKASESFSNKHLKAVSLIKAGSFKEALEVAKEDGTFDTLYNIGTFLLKEGQYSMAVALLKEALELESYNEDAYINYEIAKRLAEDEDKDNQDGEGDNEDNQGQSGGSNENDKNNESQNQGDNPNNQGDSQGDSDKQDNPNNQQNENNDDSEQSEQSGQGGSGQGGGSGSGASDGDEGEGKGSGGSGSSGGDDQSGGEDSENGNDNQNENSDSKGEGGSSSGLDGEGGDDNNESEGKGSGGAGSGGGENEENNQGSGGGGQSDNQQNQDKNDNKDKDEQSPNDGSGEKGGDDNQDQSENSSGDDDSKGDKGKGGNSDNNEGNEEEKGNSGQNPEDNQNEGKQNPDDKKQDDSASGGENNEKDDKNSGKDNKDESQGEGENSDEKKGGGGGLDDQNQGKSGGQDKENKDSSGSGKDESEQSGGGTDGEGKNDGSKSDEKGENGEDKSDEKEEGAGEEGADKDKGSKGEDEEKEHDESPEVKEAKDKLRNIKDDPTILIRNKIIKQFQQKRYNGEYEKNPW